MFLLVLDKHKYIYVLYLTTSKIPLWQILVSVFRLYRERISQVEKKLEEVKSGMFSGVGWGMKRFGFWCSQLAALLDDSLEYYIQNSQQRMTRLKAKLWSKVRFYWLRWNGTLYMDQKVCLSLLKKDQLCAIALVNRKLILKVLLKMVAMATSHSLLR